MRWTWYLLRADTYVRINESYCTLEYNYHTWNTRGNKGVIVAGSRGYEDDRHSVKLSLCPVRPRGSELDLIGSISASLEAASRWRDSYCDEAVGHQDVGRRGGVGSWLMTLMEKHPCLAKWQLCSDLIHFLVISNRWLQPKRLRLLAKTKCSNNFCNNTASWHKSDSRPNAYFNEFAPKQICKQ